MPPFSILLGRQAADLPEDNNVGPALIAWTSVLTAGSLITTVLRLWVRAAKRCLGWDDYTIFATMVTASIRTGVNIYGASIGYGRHQVYLTKAATERVNMFGWYGQILLFATLCLMKISICLLMLRIKNEGKLRWLLYAMMVGLVVTNLECIIVLLAECDPVATFWRPSAGTCWDPKIRIYSIWVQASYSIASDFVCSLLPIVLIKDLQIPFKQKVAVCGLMAMGLVATSCAAVRASTLGTRPTDITYAYAVTAMWSNTEIHLGIMATNLSLIRAIWGYFFPKSKSGIGSSHYAPNNSGFSKNGYIRSGSRHSRAPSARPFGSRIGKFDTDVTATQQSSIMEIDEFPLAPLSSHPSTRRTDITKKTEVYVHTEKRSNGWLDDKTTEEAEEDRLRSQWQTASSPDRDRPQWPLSPNMRFEGDNKF